MTQTSKGKAANNWPTPLGTLSRLGKSFQGTSWEWQECARLASSQNVAVQSVQFRRNPGTHLQVWWGWIRWVAGVAAVLCEVHPAGATTPFFMDQHETHVGTKWSTSVGPTKNRTPPMCSSCWMCRCMALWRRHSQILTNIWGWWEATLSSEKNFITVANGCVWTGL